MWPKSLYGGAAQLVRRAVLVNQPRDLVRMAHEVGRELRRDHEIDRLAVALAQVEQPPGRGVRQDLVLRIPLERDADQLGVVAARAQLAHQLAHVDLGAAVHERHLRLADDDRIGPTESECGVRPIRRNRGSGPRALTLRRVPEVDDVAVEDDVLLALEPQLAVIAAGRERAAREQVLVAARPRRG